VDPPEGADFDFDLDLDRDSDLEPTIIGGASRLTPPRRVATIRPLPEW